MLDFGSVNYLAVLVGAIVNAGVGFLWYGPLFGNAWMGMMGKTREEIEASNNPGIFVFTIVAALVTALVLALAVGAFGASTLVQGATIGAVLWIGLGATATLTTGLYEDRGTNLWLLFGAYQLVVYIINGAIFAVWV